MEDGRFTAPATVPDTGASVLADLAGTGSR
jgi:hypothetical protein